MDMEKEHFKRESRMLVISSSLFLLAAMVNWYYHFFPYPYTPQPKSIGSSGMETAIKVVVLLLEGYFLFRCRDLLGKLLWAFLLINTAGKVFWPFWQKLLGLPDTELFGLVYLTFFTGVLIAFTALHRRGKFRLFDWRPGPPLDLDSD